jgi:hypothetical protein
VTKILAYERSRYELEVVLGPEIFLRRDCTASLLQFGEQQIHEPSTLFGTGMCAIQDYSLWKSIYKARDRYKHVSS